MFFKGRFRKLDLRVGNTLALAPRPPRAKPSWISDSDLGTIDEEIEALIVLDYNDPFAEIVRFTVSGDLPDGLSVNQFDGSISGVPRVDSSQMYNFVITLHTNNEAFSKQFKLFVIANDTEVMWKSSSDLGEVNSGAGYQTIISATQVRK